jgi:predicted Zn-dependent protease
MRKSILFLVVLAVILPGCSVNPVTGESEFVLMDTAQEIELGRRNFAPMQQSQGGLYDVDPELTAYVSRVGQKVAAESGVDLPYEFVVLNNSIPNAWALPGGKIAINRGLLTELESEAELAAVLGHEVVHAAARHTASQQARAMILQAGVIGTAVAASDSDYGSLIAGGANVLAMAGLAKYGRSAELEADRYGMEFMSRAGYDPQGAVHLQETFVRLNEGHNQDWISGFFASHPPSRERVVANRAKAAALPPGGVVGKGEYAAALDRTMRLKPAYEAYEEGREALANDNLEDALAKATRALDLFPGEANFHALRGDVRLMQENYRDADTNYTRAIERRGDFFYYHLQRGIVRKELGQRDAAVADLERSLQLLPTAPAHLALGDLARQRGDATRAIEHYRVAAKSGGELGERAAGRLARLELPSNPSAYISSACSEDRYGNLVVSIRNDAPLDVYNVQVAVGYVDDYGRQRERRLDFGGRLTPGKVASVNSGMKFYDAASTCPIRVVAAEVDE